jgi:hypothetical protein
MLKILFYILPRFHVILKHFSVFLQIIFKEQLPHIYLCKKIILSKKQETILKLTKKRVQKSLKKLNVLNNLQTTPKF